MMMLLKRYFWLAYLLLVTAAAVIAADVATGYVTLRLSAPTVQPPTRPAGAAAPAVKRLRLADYNVISARNLFNANPPSGAPAPVVEVPAVDEAVQPTRLRLRLIGIAAGASPQQQYAIIEDLQRRRRPGPLPGWRRGATRGHRRHSSRLRVAGYTAATREAVF